MAQPIVLSRIRAKDRIGELVFDEIDIFRNALVSIDFLRT